MRYKAKNVDALHIALGGMPDKVRVEVESGIEITAKTVGELSEGGGMAGESGNNNPARIRYRKRRKGEQGQPSYPRFAKTVGTVLKECP